MVDKDRLLAGRLVMAESMVGSNYVDMETYFRYVRAGSTLICVAGILVTAISCVGAFVPGLWIGYWSGLVLGNNTGKREGEKILGGP